MATLSVSDLTALGYTVVDGRAVRAGVPPLSVEPKAKLPGRFRNTWEVAYGQRLSTLVLTGTIDSWGYETIRLRLANRTWWLPDFPVVVKGRLEIHEVKGFWRPQSRVKVKVAAETFPWLPIRIIRYERGQFYTAEVFNA